MKKRLVSIVIPSYNERENLLVLIPQIAAVFRAQSLWSYEVIVVDDSSPDGTANAVSRKFRNSVRVLRRQGKRDLGLSIAQGIRASHGEIIIGMDADGNHDPNMIPQLLVNLVRADIVVASRFIRGGGMADTVRYVATWLFNVFLRLVCGFPVWDNTSGFYAIEKKKLTSLGTNRIYYGYGEYHLRLVWYAKMQGLHLVEVPVYYARRRYGVSKSRLMSMVFSYVVLVFRLRFSPSK